MTHNKFLLEGSQLQKYIREAKRMTYWYKTPYIAMDVAYKFLPLNIPDK